MYLGYRIYAVNTHKYLIRAQNVGQLPEPEAESSEYFIDPLREAILLQFLRTTPEKRRHGV